jgi:3-deoxy-manno-octulosonate cytidylyltransferase (CMP-KDO synthetase)
MKFIGIIPARYESSRFPGKPLAILGNKPLVQHVYERASEALEDVFVATDDERIYEAVTSFGGKVVMTSPSHLSGTDRCAEALRVITSDENIHVDCVINIQGDEPFVRQGQIELLKNSFDDPKTDIATLVKKIDEREDIFDSNKPKVTFDYNGYALLFTRSPIPFIRNLDKLEWPGEVDFYKHIGVYAYRSQVLNQITRLPPSSLELAESLEQLRWLQNGYRIKVNITKYENMGIDTPEDLRKARELTENTSGA